MRHLGYHSIDAFEASFLCTEDGIKTFHVALDKSFIAWSLAERSLAPFQLQLERLCLLDFISRRFLSVSHDGVTHESRFRKETVPQIHWEPQFEGLSERMRGFI